MPRKVQFVQVICLGAYLDQGVAKSLVMRRIACGKMLQQHTSHPQEDVDQDPDQLHVKRILGMIRRNVKQMLRIDTVVESIVHQ
jgi:hypothetical protein